jgi:hypothetical protein
MPNALFPPLPLDRWRPTRDTIHLYARFIGEVRRLLTPPQKHYWHAALQVTASGVTTTPIPAEELSFELQFDFNEHVVGLYTSQGDGVEWLLEGQPPARFATVVLEELAEFGIKPEVDRAIWADAAEGAYDQEALTRYWQALSQIDLQLKQFRTEFQGETSPVNLWPHHFDVSLVWLTGRLIPDQDPDDPYRADEQLSFGFSTGDEGIPEPYFYNSAYPRPEGLAETPLPAGAHWHDQGFQGAVLPYARLVESSDPLDLLFTYWRASRDAGARLMARRGYALRPPQTW